MKKITLYILLIPGIYFSQIRTAVDALDNQRGRAFNVRNSDVTMYKGIDGSPYITDDYQNIIVEGYSEKLPPLRYNAYEDEMEFKKDNTSNFVDKTAGELRIKFTSSNKTYLLTNYSYNDKNVNGYLVEYVNGEKNQYGLYVKENIQLIENQNSVTNSYIKPKDPYFEKDKDLILLSHGKVYTKFPKNVKELKAIINKEDSKIDDFVKKNKINFGKTADQIQLVEFLNTI